MPQVSLVKLAQELIATVLRSGDVAIDATVGNGHDTAFLARQVGECGQVFGFDIQASAIAAAQAKTNAPNLSLIQANHAELDAHIPQCQHGKIKACMFNLGYLPGGEKSLITQSATTITALAAAYRLLDVGGLITVIAYPGHEGGGQELEALQDWCKNAGNQGLTVEIYASDANNPAAPKLFVLGRRL